MAGGIRGGADRRDMLGKCRAALYGRRQDYAETAQTVEEMVDRAGARIQALVLESDNLARAVGEWTPAQYALETERLRDKTVLSLARRAGPPGSAAAVRIAVVRIAGAPGHYCAVSDCRPSEFKGVFMRFISLYSPDISRLFLTNGDMAGALGGVESRGYDVDITHATSRTRRQAAGAPEPHARTARIPLDGFFEELGRESRAATTVRYAAKARLPGRRGFGAAPRGAIARDCRFSAAAGARALFEIMIPKAIGLSRERNRRMDASAESAGSGAVEPTVIRFGKNIFGDKDMNMHYVDMIAKMPDSSISRYHVNSHIHLSLVDYTDGSSYDIWALASDRLTVIPQIRASGASLKRLVNHIFERIGEGSVERRGD